jgi:hypothetical protein
VIAAIYPYLWSTDLLVLSETLVALLAAAVLLAAYRYVEAPSPARAAWMGVIVAAAALTRAEAILLFPLLVVPLVVRGSGGRDRMTRLAVATLATALPLVPWVAYNMSRFDESAYLSTGAGGTFADSSCDSVFYGPITGWWDNRCIVEYAGDESVRDRLLRKHAFEYIGNHQTRLPFVVAVRVGRIWEVYRPVQTAQLDWIEGRGRTTGKAALVAYLATLAFASAGLMVLRARGRPLLPFVAIFVMVTITAGVFYGAVRFRVPADVALIVLAAVAIDAMLTAARTASMGSAEMRNR